MKKLRILVVDDHQVVRKGVGAILGSRPDCEICAEASNGREAIAAAAEYKPDVVVMDISMPVLNGLEATRQILAANPRIQVLILSMHESEQLVRDVFASGARGYILKGDAGNDLAAAMDAFRNRQTYFTSTIAERILQGYLTASGNPPSPAGVSSVLSPREREIVQLAAEGKSNKEIATALSITVKTVETHRANLMHKLELHSVSDLVRYAIRNQIIEC